jgi:hypothetical protein
MRAIPHAHYGSARQMAPLRARADTSLADAKLARLCGVRCRRCSASLTGGTRPALRHDRHAAQAAAPRTIPRGNSAGLHRPGSLRLSRARVLFLVVAHYLCEHMGSIAAYPSPRQVARGMSKRGQPSVRRVANEDEPPGPSNHPLTSERGKALASVQGDRLFHTRIDTCFGYPEPARPSDLL